MGMPKVLELVDRGFFTRSVLSQSPLRRPASPIRSTRLAECEGPFDEMRREELHICRRDDGPRIFFKRNILALSLLSHLLAQRLYVDNGLACCGNGGRPKDHLNDSG